MRNLKRVFVVVVCLLSVLAILAFILENQEPVSLLFLGWAGPQLPVSVVAVLALMIGLVIGPVLGWLLGLRGRVSRKSLG
ncbi:MULTISPECIES: lipopolysaccharide assembly protein LapA domain-containing protein [Pseudomonas]|uniref:lipopolysaccharide assembly protein LapA domain-containing protein n=1 Tax=Pseudomonas TaxID=286 RepID=UPI000A1C9107|nr:MULTISPECIES: LapA family protein [Pseudomonas]WDG52047.1 LapA family protein [Pseudomonas chlororaphis]WDH86936.1 LapA family protein [Pseudomonas chlororaphis]